MNQDCMKDLNISLKGMKEKGDRDIKYFKNQKPCSTFSRDM